MSFSKPVPARFFPPFALGAGLALAATTIVARAQVEFAYTFSPAALVPDLGQTVDSRVVANPGFTTISSVSVDLELDAAPGESMWLGDLFVSLTHGVTSEDERVAILLNRPGREPGNVFGSGLGSLSATFADDASTNAFFAASSTGAYRPDGRADIDPFGAAVAFAPGAQTLSALAGTWLPSDRWSLLVADASGGDAARLAGWTLRVAGAVAPETPLTVGAGTVASFSATSVSAVTIQTGAAVVFQAGASGAVAVSDGGRAEFSGEVTGSVTASAGSVVHFAADSVLGPGGRLGGTGTITGPAHIAGTLGPGNSPGILTFTGGLTLAGDSTTEIEIAGPLRGVDHDGIDLTSSGTLTYGGTLSLFFTAPVTAGTYHIFDREPAVAVAGDFAQVSIGGSFSSPAPVVFVPGVGWTTQADGHLLDFKNETGDLTITAIPEPATVAVLGALSALAGALLRRPRRRSAGRLGMLATCARDSYRPAPTRSGAPSLRTACSVAPSAVVP